MSICIIDQRDALKASLIFCVGCQKVGFETSYN